MISRFFRTPILKKKEAKMPALPETILGVLQKIIIRNHSDFELYLSIEPYPDDYRIPPGIEVEVIGRELRCNPDGSLEITQEKENSIVLWLDDAEVFYRGRKLKAHGAPLEYA